MFDVKSDLGSWLEKVFIGHSGEILLGLDRILAVAKNLDLPIINDQVRLKSKIIDFCPSLQWKLNLRFAGPPTDFFPQELKFTVLDDLLTPPQNGRRL